MEYDIKIQRAATSGISKVDFDNIPFGRVFADHMFLAEYANGGWHSFRIVPFGNLQLHPATSALHYGQAVFEGLKAYKDTNGNPVIFRPDKNAERINQSAERMAMPGLPEGLFMQAVNELVRIDRQWIPDSDDASLYIRPFMFATDEYVGIKASDNYQFVMFCCPVGGYYSHPVKVQVATKHVRAVPGGTGAAKAAGNYAATLQPANVAKNEGFDQILWMDGYEFKYLQEIGTMNVFVQIGDTVITPELNGAILDGITRDSCITLMRDNGYNVVERPLSIDEVIEAIHAGTLNDAFGAGTAATVSQISHIGYEDNLYALSDPKSRVLSNFLKSEMRDIKRGRKPDLYNWNYKVENAKVPLD